ncbi:hypothetical protein [Halovivax sp.]|uniref:hypothetical protein n=1 Tax=Halovivax sp. TaxID=1935978 RepID=UPI0025BDEE3C|nr:hypothetical protein [Halovivax sp.]
MGGLSQLSEECRAHLEKALETDDPAEKNYHIRAVMQAGCVDEIPEGYGEH